MGRKIKKLPDNYAIMNSQYFNVILIILLFSSGKLMAGLGPSSVEADDEVKQVTLSFKDAYRQSKMECLDHEIGLRGLRLRKCIEERLAKKSIIDQNGIHETH